jgi:hypothetical protein
MKPMRFEHKHASLATEPVFRARVAGAALLSLGLVAVTLAVGMAGYHWIESISWLDAFHQAAMLLSGMGPVVDVKTPAGKLFDGIYALFCGIVLLASTAILFAPIIHRVMHRFHLENAGD